MSERKKVVIDLEESEKVQLGELSELTNVDTSGVLSVNNESERSRIWNVKVLLGETRGSTDIDEDTLVAGEIDVGGKWESTYGVAVGAPILTFKETFDTCGTIETEEPHWAYVAGRSPGSCATESTAPYPSRGPQPAAKRGRACRVA